MIRILFFAFTALVLYAQTTTLVKVEKNRGIIEPVALPKGTSGIVVHHYDKNHTSIVARAILEKSNQIRFEVFDALAQEALPKPKTLPASGDEVILGYLYDRATIIAPNLTTYQQIAKEVQEEILHPDLFATELSKAKHPAPSYEDFKNFCNKYALAKIYLALKDEVAIVDCYSFEKIDALPLHSRSKKIKLPFYSRIKEIETSIFDFFGTKEIDNYYSYYKKLLEKR
ncbi:plasminogen-binding N-terminal domain-containing protein [Nitratiruptor tergarcus]|uniref:Plasminogen-binding protein pgbA N-terminal n=1 Tax=Nitratiruptor tergarcus DSM 16512 TaxID=1069081 RepID=A0A1W1WS27_9BACT|nr:plasminogen-binding N-terminal domain-containing protein [Nitratiruptor tergarcus]SMC09005.1 Plasminogen-binding protein pgbA N-terminal [Nitratiruptor tergarcus DSM 16512]